jgi:hypothetical protein
MKRLDLKKVEHKTKIGDKCPMIPPNITEDTLFYEDGKPIGFFIENIEGKLKQYIEIANKEFRSKNVPKSKMNRSSVALEVRKGKSWAEASKDGVSQYSTILGGTPPRPHMMRPYPSISSVHNVDSAKTFIKAMLLACLEAEKVVKKIMPEQYEFQKKCIEENVPKEFRFGNLFTSSISNYNISAPFHRDTGNLKGCVNVIITKKHKAKGGDLNVPDYGATMDSSDNSLLVYPAWKNVHGVTPIETFDDTGYRNSLIFYPLKAFKKFM